jgi:hypothetical protein
VISTLRSGRWITPARIRAYSAMLITAYVIAALILVATSKGPMDALNRPIGTDFSQVWVAGASVLNGDPEEPFDPARHWAAQREFFGPETPFFGWHYPPYFLIPAAILALLPYLWSLLLWQGTTFFMYLLTIRRILGHPYAVLPAIAFPAVFINLGHGHNGFLTASLLGGGLLCLERRPAIAGLLFALLAYKPQFALIVPVLLLITRNWTAIAGGLAGIALMTLATIALFGLQCWAAFRESLVFTREVVLEQGSTGWEKIQSAFSASRMWGTSVEAAYLVQGAVSCLVVVGASWLWAGNADKRLKYALVPAASILVTPYSLDYDLMIMSPAIAFFVSYQLDRGFRPWEATLLAGIWVAPILARMTAAAIHFPLGLSAVIAFFLLVLSRAARDRESGIALARSETGLARSF